MCGRYRLSRRQQIVEEYFRQHFRRTGLGSALQHRPHSAHSCHPPASRPRTPCSTRRLLFNCNSRRHLLQKPVGTLVRTVAIVAKSEDRSLLNTPGRVARRVLISPGIGRGASNCAITLGVYHEVLLSAAGTARERFGSSGLEPWEGKLAGSPQSLGVSASPIT